MRKITLALSAAALVVAGTVSGLSAHQLRGPMMQQNQPGQGMMYGPGNTGYGGFGMMGGLGMMGGGMMGHGMMHMMTVMMDTDGDGAVSLEEYEAMHARMFNAMDLDKDGKLTSDEMQEFMWSGTPMEDDDQ